MIDDSELARRSILGFGRCSRRSGVGVLWVPSALSRRKLGEERWAEVRRVSLIGSRRHLATARLRSFHHAPGVCVK